METLSDFYTNSFGKIFSSDHPQRSGEYINIKQENKYSNCNGKEELCDKSEEFRMSESNSSKERHVSASIEVPNASRRIRKISEEPTMSDMMAAMVLSNMSYSPMLHNQYKAISPRSYDSSGVGSWSQDSRRASPYLQTSMIPGVVNPKQEAGENSPDVWRKYCKSPEDVLDPSTILLRVPTPASKSDAFSNSDKEEDISDEPQDFSMKTLLAKETEERKRLASEQQKRLQQEKIEQESRIPQIPGYPGIVFPPNVVPPQLPIPFYYPTALLSNPYATSLPNELLLRLASASFSPMSSPDVLGSSAPGHMDSKMHRYSRRAAPYYKVSDDSAISSPLRSGSPSALAFGSAPASYRLPISTPIPVSNLSYSPSRYRKMTRSPLSKTPSSYSSPSHTPRNIPTISLPTNGGGNMSLSRDSSPHYPSSQGHSSFIIKPKSSSWNNPSVIHKPSTLHNHKLQPGFYPKSSPAAATQSIPPIPIGRKVPGDGKKCRKVYGMENRDLWCTACKWKKACQRFPD